MAPRMAACMVFFVVGCTTAIAAETAAPEQVASAETDASPATDAAAPETITVKSATEKAPLLCKWETPLGSRVAKRMCHRSSDAGQARDSTRAAATTMDEAMTQYPRGG